MTASRILIVNMNYLGDALMTTPAIRALKQAFAAARIDVIAGSTVNYGALEILSMDPDIDRLIPRVNGGSISRGIQLFQVSKSDLYDLVVILPSLPFYSFVAKLTGRKVFTVPKADESRHMADHMLESIKALIPQSSASRSLVMEVPEQASEYISSVLGTLDLSKGLVAFNVGASRPQKRWPAVHFASAVGLTVDAGLNAVLVGGGNEQDTQAAEIVMAAFLRDQTDPKGRLVNLVGKTTLEQLAAVIKASSVLVTGDSGAMHIASALNVPLVALFGSTSPAFTGPYGERGQRVVLDLMLPCAPCVTHPTCGGRYDCMSGISPEKVFGSILELMTVSEENAACGIT